MTTNVTARKLLFKYENRVSYFQEERDGDYKHIFNCESVYFFMKLFQIWEDLGKLRRFERSASEESNV